MEIISRLGFLQVLKISIRFVTNAYYNSLIIQIYLYDMYYLCIYLMCQSELLSLLNLVSSDFECATLQNYQCEVLFSSICHWR